MADINTLRSAIRDELRKTALAPKADSILDRVETEGLKLIFEQLQKIPFVGELLTAMVAKAFAQGAAAGFKQGDALGYQRGIGQQRQLRGKR